MGSFDMNRIGAPASSFERSGAKKAVVDGNQAISYTIGDFAEVACPQLVRDQTVVLP